MTEPYKIDFREMEYQRIRRYAEAYLSRQNLMYINLPRLLADFAEEVYDYLIKRVSAQEEFDVNQKMLENLCKPITVPKQALDLMQEIKEEQERASGVQDLQKVEKEDDSCLCNGVGCNHCAGQGSY